MPKTTPTEKERSAILHYLRHGDAKCARCVNGFEAYWIGHKPTSYLAKSGIVQV